MTDKPRLLADVAELSNVLRAMDKWEAAGGDLDSAHGRQHFVDDLDDEAADELAGLALTNLLRAVMDERAAMVETVVAAQSRTLGDGTFPTPRDGGLRVRHGYRRVVAA